MNSSSHIIDLTKYTQVFNKWSNPQLIICSINGQTLNEIILTY